MSGAAASTRTAAKAARRAGLRYVSDQAPGIRRVRSGRGFTYRKPRGGVVRDARTLARIRKLAIPPAYTDVWISTDPRGHLQATGRDARGRKQYRYHPDWNAERGSGKFDRIVAFGRAMPKLRRRVRADLKLPGFPRDKVAAIVLSVLAETMIRVGNDEYARSNGSFGLTTLRDRHVEFLRGGRARFRFRGKSGQDHEVVLDDRRLVSLVRSCQQLPGQVLFQYRDDTGKRQPMGSTLVNAYLRDAMGENFTTKDFRTYAGTLAAFQLLARTPHPVGRRGRAPGESAFAAAEKEVVRQVADALGNTPAVCRKAYIDPAVFEAWRAGTLAQAAGKPTGARQWEQTALRFLAHAHRAG
ncbi:DNA topoisomerase IB [Lysobacter sp. M2-1]|uniref:DNA topoisomerase IB n=1 Tax=Lysobacter sp. M2-1 TaxID=2916839 RepID=UPI001F56327E|nr:DNA topoisomerase IB [Lysobacter sp. M2-1]